jgi:Spy/CpxP family protein refolding chaperone
MNARQLVLLASLAAGVVQAQHAHHGGPAAAAAPPYAGMQDRAIKALSDEERRALLDGRGSGMALAAELNGFPGPAHVLELAEALQLTGEQRHATQLLMQEHQAEARALGAQVVDAERELDRAFAGRQLDEKEVDRLTARIGQLQARLRAAHLRTHLKQSALLTPAQVARYQQLRGYAAAAAAPERMQ